jgi:hypothetical protein
MGEGLPILVVNIHQDFVRLKEIRVIGARTHKSRPYKKPARDGVSGGGKPAGRISKGHPYDGPLIPGFICSFA